MAPPTKIIGGTFRLLDGNELPLIGLGTYELHALGEVKHAINEALSSGYRLFDTANYYANERELGIALKDLLPKHGLRREDIFITTKANIRGPNVESNAKAMVDNSLRSLDTEYIDLILIHYPKDWSASDKSQDNSNGRLRMYTVFEEYKDAGRVRSIGVSNFEATHIDELWDKVRHKPTVNQCEFTPHLTRTSLVDYCKRKGIFFQAHTSLAKQSRVLYSDSVVKELAHKHKCTIQQLLLAFAYCQQIGIIPKSGSADRIRDNIQCVNIKLSPEEITQLADLNRGENGGGQYSDCSGWNVK